MLEMLEAILQGKFEDKEVGIFYLETAKSIILNYCNVTSLDASYNNAIVLLAAHLYNNSSVIKSKKEGEKSVTYANISIPSEIKMMLPRPRIGVI